MLKKIKNIYNKILNRLKAKQENKLRLKYTCDDIVNKLLYEDLYERKVAIKLPVIANIYNFNLNNYDDFNNACLIAELDMQDLYLS